MTTISMSLKSVYIGRKEWLRDLTEIIVIFSFNYTVLLFYTFTYKSSNMHTRLLSYFKIIVKFNLRSSFPDHDFCGNCFSKRLQLQIRNMFFSVYKLHLKLVPSEVIKTEFRILRDPSIEKPTRNSKVNLTIKKHSNGSLRADAGRSLRIIIIC